MQRLIHKILAPFLAVLVLLSTISWSVERHLCMGRVMDVAFFHHADGCGMEDAMAMMSETSSGLGCCDNEAFTLEGQDDLKLSWDELALDSQEFLIAFAQSYLELILVPSGEIVPETPYPPPLLVHDLNILHQAFLI